MRIMPFRLSPARFSNLERRLGLLLWSHPAFALLFFRRMPPLSKIVFLSQHDTIETIREAFRAGGYGYVAKSDAAHDLISGVRSVSQKKCYVNARFADRLCKAD